MSTPKGVQITTVAREPEWDPTLRIPVKASWQGTPAHRLVSIGDSLTHGFASGAVFQTDLSFSAIIAYELGWAGLRYPRYGGPGGLPLNLELLFRELEHHFGAELSLWELPMALFRGRQFMDEVEDYWERGPGAVLPTPSATNHVLGIYGWDLRDALVRTADSCAAEIGQPTDDPVQQIVQNHSARAALRVLPRATETDRRSTVLDAVAALGTQPGTKPGDDPDHGIETLVVFLGANNALGAVTQLRVVWSGPGYDDPARKNAFTVWQPDHFVAELQRVVTKVQAIRARHVIWCTVPHVTIAPIARGVDGKVRPGSRYFPYYTRPWISDRDFDAGRDPSITEAEARAVDSAIDQYNDAVTAVVADARRAGRDWYLLDIAGVLDRLASRRYVEDPQARPAWWRPYPLPPELAALKPVPDSRFLTSDSTGRRSGGLFSLDGVHPTTVGTGIIAQELIDVMVRAGVQFYQPNGQTPRTGPIRVDFARLIRRDTLLIRPPANVTKALRVLHWADEVLDVVRRLFA
ncbi:MAG: hypothetical protein M3460_15345 [Actinomycetota bacterium]|nr:hypothetical protein [Actinomycetota bacterium]